MDARRCVRERLQREPVPGEWQLLALGKAAGAMALGAIDALGTRLVAGCIVTAAGHVPAGLEAVGTRFELYFGAHPCPDATSLAAGDAVVRFVQSLPADARLLCLVSGGASSLVECPINGITLDDLRRVGAWALASGRPIDEVNAVRRRLSRIKGGGLAGLIAPRRALALMISDVPGDDPAVIGSGLLHAPSPGAGNTPVGRMPDEIVAIVGRARAARADPAPGRRTPVPVRIVATSRIARAAAAQAARVRGWRATASRDAFAGDAAALGTVFASETARLPGRSFRVWGGESTVTLPAQSGRGGRNQHLALSAACRLADLRAEGVWLLAAGTDGIDGNTEDAGALVDKDTCLRGADAGRDCRAALISADSGTFLEGSGDLLHTGATLTNVGDLVMGLCWGGRV